MQRCLDLAIKGLGFVAPNPMVGCVIVCDDKIVSEGYHQKFGNEHAEPNAINKLNEETLKKSTLYVNLEPCSHYGKTPPCADLIIKKGIKKVVVGNLDSNPLVAGSGIQKLKDAGIDVEFGILNEECKKLNHRFFYFHENKRPYIILKWAQTKNGFVSKLPIPENLKDNWITCNESKLLVHQWRAQEQSILVGYNTVINDNPFLTARLVKGKNPTRLIIDEKAELLQNYNVFNNDSDTIVFNRFNNNKIENIQFIKVENDFSIKNILDECYKLNITSIIIEGGTKTLNEFIKHNLWNEARVFVNPNLTFTNGISAPDFNFQTHPYSIVGSDLLYTIFNK